MRAAVVLLLFLGVTIVLFGGITPRYANAQPQPEFFSISTKTFGPDSIRVNLHWTKNEKETATLRMILMDFEGHHMQTWEKRVKLRHGTTEVAFAKFGKIRPTLFGLDSSNAVLGIEAKLSCGCETRQALHYYRPITQQALTDPKLKATVDKDKKGWFLRISAERLAREVTIVARKEGWIVGDSRFDLLPGEEREIRLTPVDASFKPRVEDFLLQSTFSQ